LKKKNRHRRNSSVPQLASEQSYKQPIDSPKTQTNKNDLIASLKKEKKAKKKSKDKKKSKNVKSKKKKKSKSKNKNKTTTKDKDSATTAYWLTKVQSTNAFFDQKEAKSEEEIASSPSINRSQSVASPSFKKQSVVAFNDEDTQPIAIAKPTKKKKKSRYLSFFARKKSKKHSKPVLVVETNDSKKLSMSVTDSLSQSDDGSDNGKRNKSVFSKLRLSIDDSNSGGNGASNLKKELDQIKKIRKQELKQLNVLKKEVKAMEEKYAKCKQEKKNSIAQAKELQKKLRF